MKHLNKTVISKNEPAQSNVLWLNPTDNQLMAFVSGQWRPVTGGQDNVITTDNIEGTLQQSPTIEAKANTTDLAALAPKIPVINHGTSDTTLTLPPNQFHIWGEVAELHLTLGTPEEGVYNEYMFEFVSGATKTTLSLPSTIEWQDDLEVEENMRYQVSIVNNIGLIVGVEMV